jgi:hypothetical protein
MTLKVTQTAIVDSNGGNDSFSISSLLNLSSTSNPTYLVVNALDRLEYTASSTGATGSFAGNAATLPLSAIGGDGRGAGIVYTWQAATGQYVNATYGTLSQLSYTDSTSANDVTNISFFGTGSSAVAQAYASNAFGLMQADATGYLGSATFASNTDFAAPPPYQATPDGVAAAAMTMVGQAWNNEGCWVLASTIAAEAGAGLPVQSTALRIPGLANGEWVPIYNGPAGSAGNWQSLVSTGDMVAFATSASSGHITTCVSGAGSTAMLVDNITYLGQYGSITNSANDGSASDVIIASPHAAAQEFAGVASNTVVIYALDTPAITDHTPSASLSTNATISLATLFSATDPAHKAITAYQVYQQGSGDRLLLSGAAVGASSAATAATATSLSALSVLAGSTANTDTLEIRASNGTYWGDWQSLTLNVAAPPPKPPVLSAHTPSQIWHQGANIALALPATLFKDPAGSPLTYAVQAAAGSTLPSWLSFDPATLTFTGTVPAGLEHFSIVVTATDALGASASETIAVTVPASAPTLAIQEPTQLFTPGQALSFALPTGSFTDPQGLNLTLRATLSNGAALPSWLKFTAATGLFSGVAPANAQALQLKVTATDTAGLSGSETFALATGTAGVSGLSLSDWNVSTLATAAPKEIPSSAGSLGNFTWDNTAASLISVHNAHGS